MSPRKQQKFYRHLTSEEKERKKILIRVSEAVEAKGIQVFPSSRQKVERYLSSAERKCTVRNLEEYKLCAATLMLAGAEKAKAEKNSRLNVHHIEEGWKEDLCLGAGNCPPHRCARLSIVERREELVERYSDLEDILGEL